MNLPLPLQLDRPRRVQEAVETLANSATDEDRGAVFTREEVVEGMLDLCGYNSDHDLTSLRLLEPSCGQGHFLFAAVKRLLASCRRQNIPKSCWADTLSDRIFAVDLHAKTLTETRENLLSILYQEGLSKTDAQTLCDSWLHQDDFLLIPIHTRFDIIIGNPPYVRQERIPNALLKEYKKHYSTLYDRADLYVLFFERCLDLLNPNGVLGFICSNRWIKNKYGGPLRAKIAADFNLDIYINMEVADAFHSEVDAYPAITLIRRTSPGTTRMFSSTGKHLKGIQEIFERLSDDLTHERSNHSVVVQTIAHNRDPWLLDSPHIINLLRALEQRFPSLEDAGAHVGIGVATGCDRVFIDDYDALDVEASRKLPLVMASDLNGPHIQWSGRGIVNPWSNNRQLVIPEHFPRFANFLALNKDALHRRHVAKKNPDKWFRTIDRIHPDLLTTPKLLIPDIKGDSTVAYDPGEFYPHHNLYTITSDRWDLQILQTLLRSSIALAFVAAYCIRMSGGFLRFQAQYLRRIRVPEFDTLPLSLKTELHAARTCNDQHHIDILAAQAYQLNKTEAQTLCTFASEARVSRTSS
ncbi:modification methylase PaeR7I [Lujinxingia litoralis]|uniref:site-specific DNA-methyltransferase (adenine-specific) n=1 Tax=Lujinxingia litoralis TaxID=2211119 RepID=A0A328C0U3_9DELT|nr:Eco57I restriction-modification methylase domain-containing protein [Lujinxingia litoralis]RAL20013.1 modification methylase PaeR7I [Lujinxingia litoralis]